MCKKVEGTFHLKWFAGKYDDGNGNQQGVAKWRR